MLENDKSATLEDMRVARGWLNVERRLSTPRVARARPSSADLASADHHHQHGAPYRLLEGTR